MAPDLKEEDGWNMFHILDEVFTYEEAACDKSRAGTYPFLWIWSVCIIQWKCDLSLF